MKILVLSFYYPPDLCAGSFRCIALVRALKAEAADVEVITTLPNRYATFDATAPKEEIKEDILVRRIALPPHQSGMLDQVKAFSSFARQAIQYAKTGQYDLVFATSSRLMTASLGAWISHQLKCPLYLDIRDIFVDTMGDILSPKIAFFLKPLLSKTEKLTCRKAKRINLVSKGFEGYFKARYPAYDFRYFTNGVDQAFIRTIKAEQRASKQKPLQVLYAGNLGEGQGLHEVIPALATRMEGVLEFKIIGDGGCRLKLLKSLEAEGCCNVEVLPPVARAALIEAYEAADVLFLHLNDYPAFYKVLPSKLFEYAAMGKPIWAGISGYAEQFVREEITNAEVFYPGDVDGAAEAFKQLQIQDRSRAAFIQKFSREHIMHLMAKDILDVVE